VSTLKFLDFRLKYLHFPLRFQLFPVEWNKQKSQEERRRDHRKAEIMPWNRIIEENQRIIDRLRNNKVKKSAHNTPLKKLCPLSPS
jgi:hypothetical protein